MMGLQLGGERIYSRDERRVCDYLRQILKQQVGCGDDPIGFLIASHQYLLLQAVDNIPLEPGQLVKPADPTKVADFNL
jgi:hypothetical protein